MDTDTWLDVQGGGGLVPTALIECAEDADVAVVSEELL